MEATTDREFMIEMNGNIKSLTTEIKHLADAIEILEENRIAPIEKRLTLVEKWQNNFDGGWKVAIVLVTILTIVSLTLGIIKWTQT